MYQHYPLTLNQCSFGKWWKWKISQSFVYGVVRVLKALWIFCLKPLIFWENCIKLTFSGCPRKFYHRVMYIAPSISLNCNMPFKFILRFEVVFWCLEWEYCTLFERFMEIHLNPPIHVLYYGGGSTGGGGGGGVFKPPLGLPSKNLMDRKTLK